MTLIKSLLLGSGAGLVAVASAQAADLPTRKGPVAVEYVRICSITVAGAPVVGWVLPGSDTCFKISGYVTGQVEGGNLKTGYSMNYIDGNATAGVKGGKVVVVPGAVMGTQNIASQFGGEGRDSIGFSTRANLTLDAVSNTAYGPLVGHIEYQFNYGSGFDNVNAGSDGGLNRAYVTWAGLTAGKIDSFFSFTGGGLGWANFFSPDRKGFNQPDLLAYTASFGGGFSATLSFESSEPGSSGVSNCGTALQPTNNQGYTGCAVYYTNGSSLGYLGSATQDGWRIPDIVGSVDVKQAWGAAHVAGVAHNIRGTSTLDGSHIDTWGWAVDAGVSFNIPQMAGSVVGITGAWSQNATWYSGIPDAMWGEDGAVNGNGQAMAIGDAFSNGDGTWAKPEAWSVTGWAAFQVTPQVNLGVEGSYGQVTWSGTPSWSPLFNSKSWLVGGIAHWDPVKNLDFEFELLYQNTQSSMPAGYLPGNGTSTTANWQGDTDGFAARFEVTRSF
jgi:hypothetical protein